MLDGTLLLGLRKCGIDLNAHVQSWSEVSELLAALDAIGRSGSNAIVKVDGIRTGPEVYTVVVSGGRLGQEFFRKDGADLKSLLSEAVSFYITHADVGSNDA